MLWICCGLYTTNQQQMDLFGFRSVVDKSTTIHKFTTSPQLVHNIQHVLRQLAVQRCTINPINGAKM